MRKWGNIGELHPFKVLASNGLHLIHGAETENPGKNSSWGWVGNPSRFLWKQIAWEISEKAGISGGSGGVSMANTTKHERSS